jgi:hypothetical protein
VAGPIGVIVIVVVHSTVNVSGGIRATMHVDMARQTIVDMNRAAKDNCGIRYNSGGCPRLRCRNHRRLLHERRHRQQHETTGETSQAWPRAQ